MRAVCSYAFKGDVRVIRFEICLFRLFLKKKPKDIPTDDDVTQSLLGLAEIAKKLRKRRMNSGALILASREVQFKIEEAQDEVTGVAMYEVRETNQMVEKFYAPSECCCDREDFEAFPSVLDA